MRLNWLFYNVRTHDGYGRYSAYMVRALRRAGVHVTPHFAGAADAPAWLRDEWGIEWDIPTVSCLPPYYLRSLPKGAGPHWLLTMTEGSECPDGWAKIINESDVAHVIVPSQHNAEVFRNGGVTCPISVVHGGTDPYEFPIRTQARPNRPYTFLALADRGARKGWDEVYQAFYSQDGFGGKTTGTMDVRLIVKSRPDGNELINDWILPKCPNLDSRIVFDRGDYANMADLYADVDCFVIPSRCEGWGMPHREAAMMGVPVITQTYSGMDDGHTQEWAMTVEGGRIEPIPTGASGHVKGEWRRCDVPELARLMRRCYEQPEWAASQGQRAAIWLREHQTWIHSARALVQLLQTVDAPERERVFA